MLATITVNTLIDVNNSGDGLTTLREAVVAANTNDIINFSVTGTINLTLTGTGHIEVNKSLTIQGPGANLLTIKAFDPDSNGDNDSDGRRAFNVSNGSSSLLTVTISGLTIINGDPDITDEDNSLGGGAIHNEENLNLIACVLTGNYAPGGGAIANSSGTLSIADCTISENATKDGGGVIIDGGSLLLTRSQVINNVVTNSGGGILGRGVALSIVDSTISGNKADERGGGVYLYQGNLAVSGSTISGNIADFDNDQVGPGGGIYNLGGALTVSNSTISGNSAGENGGGIFNDTSLSAIIDHSTITANSVTNQSGIDGGGIHSVDTALLDHTIVAGNTKGSARNDVSGAFAAAFSLVGDRRSATVNNVAGSLVGTTAAPINPLLGPLADNGGLTKTHALLTGSPAIDAGDALDMAGVGTTPLFDQRGMPFGRVIDGDGAGGPRVDIGAFEVGPQAPALLGDYTRNGTVDAADFVLWRNTLGQSVSAYSGADGSGNGAVGGEDYDVWTAHFGASAAAALGTGRAFAGLADLVGVQSTDEAPVTDSVKVQATSSPVSTTSLSMTSTQSDAPTNKHIKHKSPSWANHSATNLLVASLSAAANATDNHSQSLRRISTVDAKNEIALERAFEESVAWAWLPWWKELGA
jgi:hypothetical protein